VVDKVDPLFICAHVKDTETSKYGRGGEKYLATNTLFPDLLTLLTNKTRYMATAKADGTSALVRDGKLWKRRDQKDKKSKMPPTWVLTGKQREKHAVGYMPIQAGSKEDQWFWEVFETPLNPENQRVPENPRVRVLRPIEFMEQGSNNCYDMRNKKKLEAIYVDISELEGKTLELLGPKVQGNPHSLPFHVLMEHGIMECSTYPNLLDENLLKENLLNRIKEWHTTDQIGMNIEGIVLHFETGDIFKLHRHHLDLVWNLNTRVTPILDLVF
jgi:hypothetical protein